MSGLPWPLGVQARQGSAPALIDARRTVSYGELDGLVRQAGEVFSERCAPGSRVGLYLPNGADYVVLMLALIRAGFVACPLSTRYPLPAAAGFLRQIGGRHLVTDDPLADGEAGLTVLRPDDLQRKVQGRVDGEMMEIPAGRPVTAVFTSGSTGRPKAALHTWGNHYYNALGSNDNISLGAGDRWLLSLPLYHVGGLGVLFRCLLAGAAIVAPEVGEATHDAIRRYGITHASMVATQLRRLLDAGEAGGSTLKALLLGGSAIPPPLIEAAVAAGLPIHTSYGMSEMASQVTTTPPGAGLEQLRTSGALLPYRALRIAPDGEICVRGETLFAGYLEAEGPRLPVDEAGWFHTGDLGLLDEAGNLVVAGRRDNLFISGGENIQPEEIEAALVEIEGVEEAVVVPVPDAVFGFRPVAFIRGVDPAEAEGLAAHLGRRLPRFKIPVAFFSLGEAGRGMKVDRRGLVERAEGLLRG